MSPRGRGILYLILTMFFFSLMDVCAKELSSRVSIIQTLWARYAGQTLIVVLLLSGRLGQTFRTERFASHMVRSAFLFCATCFFFTSIALIPLANATAIMSLNPVVITLGAALFLGEEIGIRRLAAIGIAFIGALIIIRPGAAGFSLAALLPLGGALCYSGYALTTRYLGQTESVWTSLLYTALVGALVLTVAVPLFWIPPDATALVLMLIIGGLGTIGQLFLIRAFMVAPASAIAPFAYSGILFAVFWGMAIFAEFPDVATYVGALVIVAAGLYVWRRETMETRRAAQERV